MKFEHTFAAGISRLTKMVSVMIVAVIAFVGSASAQTTSGTIKGIVVDETEHLPMPGVTVMAMQGEKMVAGTATNIDGEFSLMVPKGIELRFSYIGYKPQTVAPDFSKEMEIVLEESAQKLDDIVVNGFFTRNRNTYTGAAKSLSGDELLSVSSTNLMQALSTLDAGLNIQQNNAAGSNPNNIPDLVIRSTTSLSSGSETGLNQPLIVIDGVESTLQALYDMNIQDIDRVDILKDASATALYGENAANGVIIIERKRVTQAPVRVRYTFTPQFSFADLSSYDMCNAAQKLEFERLAGLYDAANYPANNDGTRLTQAEVDNVYFSKLALINSGQNIDWMSKPVRNSFSHTHSLSVSGRGSCLDYNFTADYAGINGVMKDDSRNRYGFNIYMSYRHDDKLIVTLRADHTSLNTAASPYGSFDDYVRMNPYDSPFDSEGNYRNLLSYNIGNPLYNASLSSFDKTQSRTQNVSLDVRYNFRPNIYVTAQGSYSTTRGTSDRFFSPDNTQFAFVTELGQKGYYLKGNNTADNWAGKVVGNWVQPFDKDGTMMTLNLGWEIKKQKSTGSQLAASGFLSDDLNDLAYATNYYNTILPNGNEDLATSVGGFAAANFIFKNRYVVDGSYRLSGSSKFGSNNRTAPFWSAGLGYNLHNESFIKDLNFVDILRIRGSYGYTGSVKFNSYQAITTYQYSTDYLHFAGVGAIPITMANPDLTWQTTKKLNIGLTSSLFGDRFNINGDFYRENTTDMLCDVSLPPSSGATSVKSNLGSQRSWGIEFSLWGKLIQTRDWTWNLSVNGLHSKSTILAISDALKRFNQENAQMNTGTAPRLQYHENESPTAIYAMRSAGIDPATGKEIFIRKDGSYTYDYDSNEQVACGDTNPKLQGAISSFLQWKNLSLNINFSYRFGGDLYNSTRMSKVENVDPKRNVDVRAFTDRWKQPGDVSKYLAISSTGGQTYTYTDRFVEKDNELWLSGVTLQYNVPQSWVTKHGLQRLYISAGAEDLFRITSGKYERGTAYPYSRNLNLSLSVTF